MSERNKTHHKPAGPHPAHAAPDPIQSSNQSPQAPADPTPTESPSAFEPNQQQVQPPAQPEPPVDQTLPRNNDADATWNPGQAALSADSTWQPGQHDPFASGDWDDLDAAAPPPHDDKCVPIDSGSPSAAIPVNEANPDKTIALTARGLSGLWDSVATNASPRSTLKTPGSRPRFTPSMLAPSPTIDLKDIKIDGYQLLDVLGEGGVGVVYEAVQENIDRHIAVKMIKAEAGTDEREREKFLAEAIVTGKLDHPNIVPVHDLGKTTAGRPFYVMKRVRGTPWSKRIQNASRAENLRTLLDVCDAVAFAHARHVIHRDLKPDNVMLGEFGEVQLMDWGLGTTIGPDGNADQLTGSAAAGGTPAYMAPEMVTGADGPIGLHSDIYLLGAILWEIISGLPPHPGRRVLDCLDQARKNVIADVAETGVLVDIARRAMHAEPNQRYATVRDFRAALLDYQAHAESITMCERAAELLAQARADSDYDLFARALFGYREALRIWSDNLDAHAGINTTELEYARCAYERGDYDLALSQLDESNPAHRTLYAAVFSALATRTGAQRRLRILRRAAFGLTAALLVIMTTAAVLIARSKQAADLARDQAIAAHQAEQTQRQIAEQAEARAIKAHNELEEAVRNMVAARSEKERAKAQASAFELVANEARDELARSGMLLDNSWWSFDAARAAQLQQAAASKQNIPVVRRITLPGDTPLELRLIPPGEFVMGSPPTEPGRSADEHLHRVHLTNAFYLATCEFTVAQYSALLGPPPTQTAADDQPRDPNAPIAGLTFRQVRNEILPALQQFAPAGYRFDLPTEAQWEYACRAGRPGPYHADAPLDQLGWYLANSTRALHPVAELAANNFGLHDMHGNVAELCGDHYAPDTYLTGPTTNPAGPRVGERPLVRGGSIMNTAAHCRSAYRSFIYEKNAYEFVGFRVALIPVDAAPMPAPTTE